MAKYGGFADNYEQDRRIKNGMRWGLPQTPLYAPPLEAGCYGRENITVLHMPGKK
ncbi:MAG: hypothetical protein BWX55_01791 [Deltaproteobacteria bacterium ADurb.Bin022]|nr:MAG: hypothetical protein BWX55_01791 [Deltaproteobacteria bacterium ADurb.Bin022]